MSQRGRQGSFKEVRRKKCSGVLRASIFLTRSLFSRVKESEQVLKFRSENKKGATSMNMKPKAKMAHPKIVS